MENELEDAYIQNVDGELVQTLEGGKGFDVQFGQLAGSEVVFEAWKPKSLWGKYENPRPDAHSFYLESWVQSEGPSQRPRSVPSS